MSITTNVYTYELTYIYIYMAQDFSFQTNQAALPSGPPLAEDQVAVLPLRLRACRHLAVWRRSLLRRASLEAGPCSSLFAGD